MPSWWSSGDGMWSSMVGGIFGTVDWGKIPKVPISVSKHNKRTDSDRPSVMRQCPKNAGSEARERKSRRMSRPRPRMRRGAKKRQKTVNVTICVAHKLVKEGYLAAS